MGKCLNRLNSFSLLGTIFSFGSYFVYKVKELIGFLYTGILFLTALMATYVIIAVKKELLEYK
ncbi:hypothetical protein OZL92_05235 [Bacillus sonorensis]|uniref:Uncharacterized protein n=2 Tax=Bacillus sonorensis TaxID=119858 RepID=M5PA35_9BACI|nr:MULTISPECIES: hypothetical protein [Bacillus]TWK82393.1 hypothetical protein CHCC20335_3436 [Bacillus paralicheniformis]ASB88867.1 hypothetical protein S101395_02359 [Bacillus sonorensis]EME76328.1 hypothetical protein BSONL12_01047 [Bacillus sonorensis L12]MBG9915345.1 hypothetical protein [Bacillus sonorensis]MCF7618218.1 hypothetical protein [Bacillus sonorensis]